MWRALPTAPAHWLAALSLALAGCWHAARDGAPPPSPSSDATGKPELLVGPGRIVPDVAASSNVVDVLPDGSRRLIVSGMRIVDHPDGSIERAREVLPNGTARVLSLPSRIGGGLVVYIVSSNGTQLWRTKTWLDRLEPLSELRDPVDEMVAGFDRLYVRLTTGEIRAIDPDSGNQLSLGPLPPATRIRILAFADAWRAVAVVDFRGALATFDAGNTWRPVPLDGVNVNQLGVKDGDFALDTPRGRFMLSAGGELSRDEAPREGPQAPGGNEAPAKVGVLANVRPFGRRPLRAAIEDGWPLAGPGGEPAAVFAQGGAIHRVGLETGRLFETKPGAFRDDDGSCHAIALRGGFGFVCTTATAGSAIYAVEPPLVMREVARFARPRVVIASGNGGFVARGPCARDAAATDAAFCFFFPSGEEKQVSPPAGASEANADIRPVALRDGRALFVFSSAAGSGSKLFVARGGDFDAISLSDRNAVLRRAYLLEGIEERAPGILGGWALVSEELRGVRIGIDGKAEVGPASAKVDRTVVAGRFGFDWAANGRGFETVDGGMSWTPVDLAVPDLAAVPRSVASCGPVGCVRDKWLRIGWGRASEAPDLPLARTPDRSRVRLAPARDVSFRCQATGEIAGPPPPPPPKLADARPKKSKQPAAPPAGLRLFPRGPLMPLSAPPIARPAPDPRTPSVGGPSWSPFRGMPAPALAAGSIGLEAGTDPPIVMQARVYTWGPRGAEWLHSGYVQARFDDRFEFLGIRTTAATAPPWADEDRASDALGLTTGQPVNWSALLDPSGRAAVLVAQRGGGRADLYAAAAGEPLVLWRDVDNGALPAPNSVVRIGSTWFFLHSLWTSNAWSTTVYRVDGGVARRLARLPRVPVPPAESVPKLMRRAQSKGLGILVQGAPGFDQVIRDWYVLPIDPETGDLDEPVRLYGSDLEGHVPERCSPERDGWMVNTELTPYPPTARVVSPVASSLSSIELRLRLDPGTVCVDAIAARTEGLPSVAGTASSRAASDGADIPMAATETSSGRKWLLRCTP